MKRLALLMLASLVTACGEDEPIAPDLQLYYAVCVDSTLAHPTYPCTPPDTAYVSVTVTIPNPVKP